MFSHGLCGGAVVSTARMFWLQILLGSFSGKVCIFCMSAWIFSGYSGFVIQSKYMYIYDNWRL